MSRHPSATGRPVSGICDGLQPECGFRGEHCEQSDLCAVILGVAGGLGLVCLVVGGVAYRNWRYEQELDSLLWKIDYKELHLEVFSALSVHHGAK